MPRGIPNAKISTDDLTRAAEERTLPEISGGVAINLDDIEVIAPKNMRSIAEQEAFMQQKVIVQIEPDEDPNSPVFIYTGHDGIVQYIKRGEPQSIKRKFLYSLIAAKRTQFASVFGKDMAGNEFNRLTGRTNTTYRLQVLDDSPEGLKEFARWMQEK